MEAGVTTDATGTGTRSTSDINRTFSSANGHVSSSSSATRPTSATSATNRASSNNNSSQVIFNKSTGPRPARSTLYNRIHSLPAVANKVIICDLTSIGGGGGSTLERLRAAPPCGARMQRPLWTGQ